MINRPQSASPGKRIMNDRYYFCPRNNETIVRPYVIVNTTSVKGRWVNRRLIDVLESEFTCHEDNNNWNNLIIEGLVVVNDKRVDPHCILQSGDKISTKSHR